MAQTVTNVSTGKPARGGAISWAPLGATLPTDATTALTGFTSLGYVSEDGLTNDNSIETDDVKAWGGDTVLNILTEVTDTFQFTLIEVLNPDVLKFVFGEDNVTGTLDTGISVTANGDEAPSGSLVIDMIMREGALKRIVVPVCKLSERGEVEYTDEDATGYECTVTAMNDANGATHYEYIVKPQQSNSENNGGE